MTTLIVTNKNISSLLNGYDLRVWYLCKELAEYEKLVLLPICLPTKVCFNEKTIDSYEGIYQDVQEIKNEGVGEASFFRHARLREAEFFQYAYKGFFQRSVKHIKDTIVRYKTDKIIVFGSDLAGFIRPFRDSKVLYDVCDSIVLGIEREIAISGATLNIFRKIKMNTQLWRWKRTEGCLPRWFKHVTTINKADSETIKRLSGGMSNISTIPNGVDPSIENKIIHYTESRRNGIVFWGNMAFAPNRKAISYFYENIYRPYLAELGVEWCIVGRDPDPWLLDAAKCYPSIRLTGFVEDLYSLIVEYPVMVNPMISGSGLKNKLLEAFALRIAVVSTPLGIESIDGAIDGIQYLEARNPVEFANSIKLLLNDEMKRSVIVDNARKLLLEKYTWRKVGEQWLDVFNNCMNN